MVRFFLFSLFIVWVFALNSQAYSQINISAGSADIIFTGDFKNSRLGTSISAGGDMNTDEIADLAVGIPGGGSNCFTNTAGTSECDGRVDIYQGQDGSLIMSLEGDSNTNLHPNEFGKALSFGDIDGDQISELIVGAPSLSSSAFNSGVVYVYAPWGALITKFECDGLANTACGRSIASQCDVNRDGTDDVLVGANNGVYVYSGQTFDLIRKFESLQGSEDDWARSLSCAGDVNQDGYDDVLVGAPSDDQNGNSAGAAYIFSGKSSDLLHALNGPAANDSLGQAVSRIEDVDGDQVTDLLVGANQLDGPGYALLLSGQTLELIHRFDNPSSCPSAGDSCDFGAVVSSGGDLNSDGIADILISDPSFESSQGRLWVYSGLTKEILFSITGEGVSGDGFSAPCTGVLGGFDANDDGEADFICGAPSNDTGEENAGRAYLFLSGSGSIPQTEDTAPTEEETPPTETPPTDEEKLLLQELIDDLNASILLKDERINQLKNSEAQCRIDLEHETNLLLQNIQILQEENAALKEGLEAANNKIDALRNPFKRIFWKIKKYFRKHFHHKRKSR